MIYPQMKIDCILLLIKTIDMRSAGPKRIIRIYISADLVNDPSVLQAFEKAYNDFCDSIHNEVVRANYCHEQIVQSVEQNGVVITKADSNRITIWHLYYVNGETSVLNYSVNSYRSEGIDKAEASRLNKLLHWEDMKWFRKKGYVQYDWGNVSTNNPNRYNGIDTFKAGFGGEIVEQQSAYVSNSIIGNIIIAIMRFKVKRQKTK